MLFRCIIWWLRRWGSALYPGLRHSGLDGSAPEPAMVLISPEDGVAACGDFASGSRLPDVITNAHSTARAVSEMLKAAAEAG
jgi:hypothetical protein